MIVKVAVRVRPFTIGERQGGARRIISAMGDKVLVAMTPYDLSKGRITFRVR